MPIKVSEAHADAQGNLIKLKVEYDGEEICLYNIYGPNEDNPDFFQDIFDRISNNSITNVMIFCDFNVTLNPDIDNHRYVNVRNNAARHKLKDLMTQYGFFDVFRSFHEDKKQFTWRSTGGPQRARLDMCIASETMRPFITDYQILTAYKSDHSPIMITIDFSSFARGKGYWKFNNSLLNDLAYIGKVKEEICITCAKYVTSPLYTNFLQECSNEELDHFKNKSPEELQILEFNINPNLMFEMVLNDIRNMTIAYSTQKNKMEKARESQLHRVLKDLQDIKASGIEIDNLDEELSTATNNYNDYIQRKNENSVFMKDVQNASEGEKPSAYFCSLEKNFSAQKYISRLKVKR